MIDLDTFDFDSCTPESLKAAAKEKILEDFADGQSGDRYPGGSYTDALLSEAAYMVYNAIMTAPDLMAAAVPTADGGSHLDRFADIFGILRSPGTRAGVTVTFTGTDNTIIPEGGMGCNRQRRTIPHIDRCHDYRRHSQCRSGSGAGWQCI